MATEERCPACTEAERDCPDIHEEEPGYQCPDCGGSGRAEDAISLDESLR